MPNICEFYNIFFNMYNKSSYGTGNSDEHDPAHLHIIYKENECKVYINKFKIEILKGKLKKKTKKIIKRFINKHKDELLEMWKTQDIHKIEY